MIRKLDNVFVLDTNSTTYCFQVTKSGHLEHLYYGRRITINQSSDVSHLAQKYAFASGNTSLYSNDYKEFSLEEMRLEMSSYGKGDVREPFVEITYSDGGRTSDFIFLDAIINEGRDSLETLPCSYSDKENVMQLVVTLKEASENVLLKLNYYVYPQENVIARQSTIINESEEVIKLNRLMSMQLDLDKNGYVVSTFNGGWAREMKRYDHEICQGNFVNSSITGNSSNRANPFIMLSEKKTDEDNGNCYGFNLIYSGNHYESVSVGTYNKTRVVTGINPSGFEYAIAPGQRFEAPEAVMTYSNKGFNEMSHHMHDFVRECIVRGKWKKKERPVLLNSWEAAYFDINESKLLKLAKAAAGVGIELFVMDDGWFGKRDNDNSSLGDWFVNKNKLPNGLEGISRKVNDLGLDFGIWVEPEMVNEDSDLYRAHPDWALMIPGKPHSEGRNQRILDFTNPEVVEYMTDSMRKVFSAGNIAYVKWDMNRNFTDVYSPYLPKERQGEVFHRYICGVYKMMDTLTKEFPEILFEGCAAGGDRFDLGILCYFPQIWASDDTDAVCRVNTQTGYSYGYPQSVYTAHVSSCPNHQTLRVTPLNTRFNVAAFAVCGYECNLVDMNQSSLDEIKKQVEAYKEYRSVFQFGQLYRGRCGNIHEWTVVSLDKTKAVGMIMQELVTPNKPDEIYYPKGLNEDGKYHVYNVQMQHNIKEFGDLINTAAPIHVKQDSFIHNTIAKFVNMPGEKEDYISYGDAFMSGGVHLTQGFGATGYNENVRHFPDFASRIYYIDLL